MKKSLMLFLLFIVCSLAVTGTIAYFNDHVAIPGVIKSGNLNIEQFELERTDDGSALQTYNTRLQAIYPSMGTETHSTIKKYTYSTMDKAGNEVTGTLEAALMADTLRGFVDKIVLVKNNCNLNIYVRTFVAVPTAFAEAIHLDWNKEGGWSPVEGPIVERITVAESGINDVEYAIYYVVNEAILPPGASAAPSLLGFYMDSKVNHNGKAYTLNGKELGSGSELKILVATQASQAIPNGIGESSERADARTSLQDTYDVNLPAGMTIGHPWMLQ